MTRAALKTVIDRLGGQKALADLLAVHQTTVSYWLRTGNLPAQHVLAIEKATGVSRHELRPDIYPPKENAA